ncbi:MAG: SsgA family sporulation/cell division regulator [Nocardioidaceae bacterium]
MTLQMIDAAGVSEALAAELRYDSSDPYAVAVVFTFRQTRERWVFARDLLTDGLFQPTGHGDVQVWPCLDHEGRAVTILELCSPDGAAMLQVRSDELSEFCRRTEELVASGTETGHLDVAAAVAELLA